MSTPLLVYIYDIVYNYTFWVVQCFYVFKVWFLVQIGFRTCIILLQT
jgi:hypothetical protein